MFKLYLEKAEEPENKLQTSAGSKKKQENSRKKSSSASLTTLKPLMCGSQQTVENSEKHGNTEHLSCLLRNLSAGQEATVRTGHGGRPPARPGRRTGPLAAGSARELAMAAGAAP